MANIPVKSAKGQAVGQAELSDAVFAAPVNEAVLHAVVVAQQAARRRGTHATKNRAKIHGGGRKPWRQKGTGRARAGSRRSPLWVGGATVFGPQPRDYTMKINRKVRQGALRSALSHKAQEGCLHVVRDLGIEAFKTKQAVALLKALGVGGALVVIDGPDPKAEKSFANLPDSKVIRAEGLNVYDVLDHDHLIVTEAALSAIHRRLVPAA